MRKSLVAAALILASCSSPQEPDAPRTAEPAAAASPGQAAEPEPAAARLVEEKDELLEFTYGWSVEAAAVPELVAILAADMAKQGADSRRIAEADRAARGPGVPFHGHYFTKTWATAGTTPRLLSLVADIATYTGGAHGMSGFEALLWDRETRQPIAPGALFGDAQAAWALVRPVYCEGLDKERAAKRQETLPLKGDDWMVECPPLAEQVVVPVDENKDGRFERLRVLLAPYNAGPYAEGSYKVDVPVTEELRALVKPDYRGSF